MIHNHQHLVIFYNRVPISIIYLLLKGLNVSETLILELILEGSNVIKFSQSYTSAVKVFIHYILQYKMVMSSTRIHEGQKESKWYKVVVSSCIAMQNGRYEVKLEK